MSMEKRTQRTIKTLISLMIFIAVFAMCGCKVNTDFDVEKEVDLILNPSQSETDMTEENSEDIPTDESALSSESIPVKEETAGDSQNSSAERKTLMLIMGVSLTLLGIVLLFVGTRMDLYSRVGEFYDTTRQAMAGTLKKDIACFFGSLCKLLGGLALLIGFLCLVTFFTWTGM